MIVLFCKVHITNEKGEVSVSGAHAAVLRDACCLFVPCMTTIGAAAA